MFVAIWSIDPASIGTLSFCKVSIGNGQVHIKIKAWIVGRYLSVANIACLARSMSLGAKVKIKVGFSDFLAPVVTIAQNRNGEAL